MSISVENRPAVKPVKASTKVSGLLLNRLFLIITAGFLFAAAWSGYTVIVVILALLLAAAGFARLQSFFSLKGVKCERILSENRAFPGEVIELKYRLENRKILPLPWIQIADQLPSGFADNLTDTEENKAGFSTLALSTSISPYAAVTLKHDLNCKKRGYYPLGPMIHSSGDIFGFYLRQQREQNKDCVIVYPEIFQINHVEIPSVYPLGESRADKRIFEDPSRTIGIRDYSPGDSLRRIHWKASARRQQLQVKVFESTTTLHTAVFLAAESFIYDNILNSEYFELGISTAASLANFASEKRSQVGFWTNAKMADTGQPAAAAPGSGMDKLIEIFEAAAKIIPVYDRTFCAYFQEIRKNLPMGITLAFVISQLTDEFKDILFDLQSSGYKLLVFQAGNSERKNIPAEIPWYSISQKGEPVRIDTQESLL